MDDYQVALIAAALTVGPISAHDQEGGHAQEHYDGIAEWADDFLPLLRHLRHLRRAPEDEAES